MATETIEVDSVKSTTSAAEVKTSSRTRLAYVDKLRVAFVMLVVAHHAAQAYGPTGGGWPVTNPTTSQFLKPFFDVNPMFFMGLFFLISGYFVPGAFDRKGAGAFLKTRLLRLGLPALVLGVFVMGPIQYFGLPDGPSSICN